MMLAQASQRLSLLKNSLSSSTTTSSNSASRIRHKSSAMDASLSPLAGLWKPNPLKGLYYGSDTVKTHLLSCLPNETSKAFIITGKSLATKTPLISQVESLLGSRHAGTFSNIREHAPIDDLDKATELIKSQSVDTVISVGGGSPIDSSKALSYRVHESTGKFLTHIAIPTTLSASECTSMAGYTGSDGVKTGVASPDIYPSYIIYDSKFALHTPPSLFASTGIRALDHAVEMQYHANATLLCQQMCLNAIRDLFKYLPAYQENPKDEQVITHLFLAAFASLGFLGLNVKGGLGLSHTMGYALGSPYGIPHGITSCISLGSVVKLKSHTDAAKIAPILEAIGTRSGDDFKDAQQVGDRIDSLVKELGFKTTLTEKGVGKDQLDTILSRATGGLADKQDKSDQEKKMVEGLRQMVESFY